MITGKRKAFEEGQCDKGGEKGNVNQDDIQKKVVKGRSIFLTRPPGTLVSNSTGINPGDIFTFSKFPGSKGV